jgi:hypothetical protein
VLKQKKQEGWWESMKQELYAMETNGVWEKNLMSSIPPGWNVVGYSWVLTQKDDGTLGSRTVDQGFLQVPGKDFADSNAPDMTAFSFCLKLINPVLMKLRTVQFDIDTGFLYSELGK